MSIFFFILAAAFNAVMDILENENFSSSIFRNMNQKFWYKRESWKWAKKFFGWKFDGWHIAKSLMVIFLCLSVVTYVPVFGFVDFIFYGMAWNVVFNLMYNKVLK